MAAVTLIIAGDYGSERIVFNPEVPPVDGTLLPVEGFWPDEKAFATYEVIASYECKNDGTYVLRLRVDKDSIERGKNNGEIREDLEFYWGTSVITINPSVTSATATWIPDGGAHSASREGLYCLVIGQAANRMFEYEQIERIQRQQIKLRSDLLKIDKGCILTFESTPEALQAAHICEVKNGGRDDIGNAVLMRSDLHALYDRGFFSIALSGEVTIDRPNDLSKEYLQLLKTVRISPDVIRRIFDSLQQRRSH